MAESTVEKISIAKCSCAPCPNDSSHKVCFHSITWSYGGHTEHATDPNGPGYATTPVNRERASRALAGIRTIERKRGWKSENPIGDLFADALADLMHLAAQYGLHFYRELEMAQSHFDEEKTGEEEYGFGFDGCGNPLPEGDVCFRSYGELTAPGTDPNGLGYATTPVNRKRASRALAGIRTIERKCGWKSENPIRALFADALADLMHLAAQNGLHFYRELEMAQSRFDEEKTGEEEYRFGC